MQALGNTGDGVFVVDGEQRIITWNKGAENILGHAESDVLGHYCYELIGGRLRSGKRWCRADCNVQCSIRRGAMMHNFDLLASTKNDKEVWINFSIVALPRKDKPLTLHLLHRVSHRERSEEAVGHILRTLKAYGLTKKIHKASKEAVVRGEGPPVPSDPLSTLSPRELEILGLLTRGLPEAAAWGEGPPALSDTLPTLSQREHEILGLLTRGFSTEALAERLGISRLTVRSHIRNILRKMGLHSRTEAVSFALRNGLL